MLITMAVYDTEANERTDYTRQTLISLAERVDWKRHRLFISDNGSCDDTLRLYESANSWLPFNLILNGENLGTANAINKGWKFREQGEHAVKMDNDVVVNYTGWADEMEEVFARDPVIGICGLKRKDIEERPGHHVTWYNSELEMLPHEPGQRWIVVEKVSHVIGTCQGYSSDLLDRIGYLYQHGKYGFDDSFASLRARIIGYKRVFLPHIDIDHVDPGGTQYTDWKCRYAGEQMDEYNKIVDEYISNKRPVYFGG
jgi:GT2 family glycosyltransferase